MAISNEVKSQFLANALGIKPAAPDNDIVDQAIADQISVSTAERRVDLGERVEALTKEGKLSLEMVTWIITGQYHTV